MVLIRNQFTRIDVPCIDQPGKYDFWTYAIVQMEKGVSLCLVSMYIHPEDDGKNIQTLYGVSKLSQATFPRCHTTLAELILSSRPELAVLGQEDDEAVTTGNFRDRRRHGQRLYGHGSKVIDHDPRFQRLFPLPRFSPIGEPRCRSPLREYRSAIGEVEL